jgi:hypothetical protein
VQRSAPTHTVSAPLTVSMVDGIVVLEPPTDIDLEATEALLHTIIAAVGCGETVMLDLDHDGSCAPDQWPHAGQSDERGPATDDADRLVVRVVGPGYIRVRSRHETWTLDIARHRFCRSAAPVDPKFVGAESWTPICAVWVDAHRSTILTPEGAYVSAATNWALLERRGVTVAA